jgi:uncharacterized cofD-like protein
VQNEKPNIVVIGGGSGSSTLLSGLKQHPVNLTAIVTTFDSGGSSGILRAEFGYPPFGDLRQCLVALSDSAAAKSLRNASEFRFRSDSSLKGHSLGNLLLAALTSVHQNVEAAITEMSCMLDIKGDVIPVSLHSADLCAELEDDSILRGESNIDLREEDLPRIKGVFLDPIVEANPRALKAIAQADAIILGPGDLYTSIVPNLLVRSVSAAIARSSARKIYVCNLMTKYGETGGFKASDFAREIVHYLGGHRLDSVLINNKHIPSQVRAKYASEAAVPVENDESDMSTYAHTVISMPLSINEPKVRHDPEKLAEAVLSAMPQGMIEPLRQFATVS